MKRLFLFAGLILATACSSGGGSSSAPLPIVTPVPTPQLATPVTAGITLAGGLYQAVLAPDSRVWFAEFSGDKVAAMTSAGVVTEYTLPVNSQPNGICVGSDGNIWTGGYGGTIYKISTAGVVLGSFPIAGAHFGGLVAGPGGLVWFTDYGNNQVGSITTAGVTTEYGVIPNRPNQIAVGSDGNLWITNATTGTGVTKISPAGAVLASYSTGIPSNLSPSGIVAGPDGNLYIALDGFNNTINDAIAKVTMAGTISILGTIAPSSYPNELGVGSNGNIYFSEYDAARIGKITVATGTVADYAFTPVAGDSRYAAVATGADGRLYLGSANSIYPFTP